MSLLAILTILISAWVVGFSGAMAPGPISTLVIGEAGRRGFWAGPLITLGHAVAELAIVLALAFGLQDLMAGSHLPMAIALLGGVFLVWMGISALRDALRAAPTIQLSAAAPGKPSLGPVVAGLGASISNPYWFIWWSSVGAGYIVTSLQFGAAGVAAFYVGHILSDLSWNSILSLLMASGRRWLPGKVTRIFLAVAGAFMIALGIYFVWSGVRMLGA